MEAKGLGPRANPLEAADNVVRLDERRIAYALRQRGAALLVDR
jgi:hypothetical protein